MGRDGYCLVPEGCWRKRLEGRERPAIFWEESNGQAHEAGRERRIARLKIQSGK